MKKVTLKHLINAKFVTTIVRFGAVAKSYVVICSMFIVSDDFCNFKCNCFVIFMKLLLEAAVRRCSSNSCFKDHITLGLQLC